MSSYGISYAKKGESWKQVVWITESDFFAWADNGNWYLYEYSLYKLLFGREIANFWIGRTFFLFLNLEKKKVA